jgi:hypothetical protein
MDTILNNLDTGIKIALLGVLTGPVLLLIFKLFGKIISENKVIRDTKMVDLEINGLIYSLNVAIHLVESIIIFWLLNNFKLINQCVGVIGIIIFAIILTILFFNLISIPIGGFIKLQEIFDKNLLTATQKDGENTKNNFFNDISVSFNNFLKFTKQSIKYLGLMSFLNFLTCFVIVKNFGFPFGALFITFCLSNIVIIACLDGYKKGEKAICNIYLKQGDILEDVTVKCINDLDVYIIDGNEARIISKDNIFEIRIKKIDKNINIT